MRFTIRMVLPFLAVMIVSPIAQGEPVAKHDISFSIPFLCRGTEGRWKDCLSDEFKAGLSVVLVGLTGNCSATTADSFTWENELNYQEFQVTRVVGSGECFTPGVETEIGRFDIAVVGADLTAVRVIPPRKDKSPVPETTGLEARKLADSYIKLNFKGSNHPSISDAQPTVLRAENVTLLTFELRATDETGTIPWEPGPTVALTDSGVFLLEGTCTYGTPIFFSVNDRLYLAYDVTIGCCGCGNSFFFIYDLSSGTPKKVYENGKFAD